MAILYLGNQIASLAFLPFHSFDWMARILPGDLITTGIDAIVKLIYLLNLSDTSRSAKLLEQLMALLMFVTFGLVLGVVITWFIGRFGRDRRQQSAVRYGIIAGLIGYIIFMIILISLDKSERLLFDAIWLAIVVVSWGAIIGLLLARISLQPADEEIDQSIREARRAMIYRLVVSSAGITLGAVGLGRVLGPANEPEGAGQPLAQVVPTQTKNSQPIATPAPTSEATARATTRDHIPPAPGTRPELTANEDFYRIDINTFLPSIDQENWSLDITGLFDNPQSLNLEDLMKFPPVTQTITLRCISNPIGGDLIGTSNWTGLRLRDLLAELGLRPEAKSLVIEARDGFFETVVLADMLDARTLLVYGMNGETLPKEHGFPLRIYIPDRYGMKQPKWITRITAVEDEPEGYWVVRGWSKEARPQIVSVIDNAAVDQPAADNLIPIGGIAWAGDRGISKVELQFDYGEWIEATLRTPPLSPLTWVQWRYDWAADEGRHLIRVRATDGSGAQQIEADSGVRPDGATGFHQIEAKV
jgi:DMSO/TMAO reductase YedYZ molybdopterin-dependent catalytic subunit